MDKSNGDGVETENSFTLHVIGRDVNEALAYLSYC